MPKSKNRKNHKKKVQQRRERLAHKENMRKKQFEQIIEQIKKGNAHGEEE